MAEPDYLDVQRRRATAYVSDEGGVVVDEPGVVGWAAADRERPTGRLFVHAPLAAGRLRALLETYWPLNVAIVGAGSADCVAVLNSLSHYRGVAEAVTGMLLRSPETITVPPLPAALTARLVRRGAADPAGGVPLELAAEACRYADPALAEGFSAEQFVAHLRHPANAVLLAATHDGRVVGTSGAVVVGTEATIYLVSTDPAYRGRGLATAMTARAVREAVERGAELVCLDASTAGHGIYLRLGFTPVARLRVWNRLHP